MSCAQWPPHDALKLHFSVRSATWTDLATQRPGGGGGGVGRGKNAKSLSWFHDVNWHRQHNAIKLAYDAHILPQRRGTILHRKLPLAVRKMHSSEWMQRKQKKKHK